MFVSAWSRCIPLFAKRLKEIVKPTKTDAVVNNFFILFLRYSFKQAKTNLSNNNPLSHSDLQALSNAIDNPVNNAKEAEKMLSNLSDDVIAENLSIHK
jgi:hypothetical protein